MMEVVLDTNALTLPYQFRIDVFEQAKNLVPDAEFVTLKSVVDELRNIDDRRAGAMALKLIEANAVRIVDEPGETDSAILAYAQGAGAAVFTNDKELKKSCLKFKVPVIFMKKGKTLSAEGLP
jgi:rRNA-processing protein FCF1